jgi:multidrug efflux pump subunit AcrA (membrane-fusion protein)
MTKNKKSNLGKYQIQAWAVVIVGFFGFIIWAALYPMNQGVAASGYVVSQKQKVVVTSPVSGLVKVLRKKAGDSVIEGEVIIDFDKSVIEHSLKSTGQALRGIQVSNFHLKKAYSAKALQLEALDRQYRANKKLMEAGFLSQYALSNIQNQLALAESESLELKAQIAQAESKFEELKEQMSGISQQMLMQKIISPVNGSLMNLIITSSGVNVSQGQVLMEIVPDGGELVIDARIPIDFVDKVEVGMDVDIMFPTVSGNKTNRFIGKVNYISADKITDARNNQVYLESRISILNQPSFDSSIVKVGMPVSVIINTGKRTMLSYMTRPFVDRVSTGLK